MASVNNEFEAAINENQKNQTRALQGRERRVLKSSYAHETN
jgi:hypothetical protein